MTGKRVSETELVLPALYFISRVPDVTTSRLKSLLVELLKPTGKDAEIAKGRADTYFEQKVRNLVSHRTLQKLGFANYRSVGNDGVHTITESGKDFLQKNMDALDYLFSGDFNYDDIQSSVANITKEGKQRQKLLIYPVFQYEDQDYNIFLEQALRNVIPVCSNCHRMIHREKNAPMPVEELKRLVQKTNPYF